MACVTHALETLRITPDDIIALEQKPGSDGG